VIGDVTKLENFDACQQYMKQILLAHKARKGSSTTISAVNTNNRRSNPTQGGGKKKKQKTSSSLTKNYTSEEWGKLSVDECTRIMKLRKEKKAQTCLSNYHPTNSKDFFSYNATSCFG
jgi:hypothetical protein